MNASIIVVLCDTLFQRELDFHPNKINDKNKMVS